MQTIKCMVVGDSLVGKSCLLIAYKFNIFAEDHIPKICEDYSVEVTAKGKQINLSLCDTADNEDYKGLRLDSYFGSDVILLCFSVLDPESFKNISSKWHPELQQHSRSTPIILLGTKTDLREDEFSVEKLKIFKKAEPITYKQGLAMAKEIKAVKYLRGISVGNYAGNDKCNVFLYVIDPVEFKSDNHFTHLDRILKIQALHFALIKG